MNPRRLGFTPPASEERGHGDQQLWNGFGRPPPTPPGGTGTCFLRGVGGLGGWGGAPFFFFFFFFFFRFHRWRRVFFFGFTGASTDPATPSWSNPSLPARPSPCAAGESSLLRLMAWNERNIAELDPGERR